MIKLKISAEGLEQQDLKGINPMCKIYIITEEAIGYENYQGETEILPKTDNPDW